MVEKTTTKATQCLTSREHVGQMTPISPINRNILRSKSRAWCEIRGPSCTRAITKKWPCLVSVEFGHFRGKKRRNQFARPVEQLEHSLVSSVERVYNDGSDVHILKGNER